MLFFQKCNDSFKSKPIGYYPEVVKQFHKSANLQLIKTNHPNNLVQMKFIFFVVLLCCSTVLFAQTGGIKGRIANDKGAGIAGASITINGTSKGVTSNANGEYRIPNLAPGVATVKASSVSYDSLILTVTVVAGEEAVLDFVLTEANKTLQGVVVSATGGNRESESRLLSDQKKAVVAVQAIGAQELSRKGISNAEAGVARVSGISKQEGVKNVFVRGLGDRYNTTTFNGFVVPSEDPEFKNISLGFFTNDMIQSIGVNKVFTASMNGDVGGALIDIKPKQLIGNSELQVSLSSSINSQVPGSNLYLPEGLNKLGYSFASNGPKGADNQFISDYSFNTSLDPIKKNNPINGNLVISGGKKFGSRHRFYMIGSIDNNFEYQEGVTRLITATSPQDPYRDFTYQQSKRNTSHLLMGNLELNFNAGKLFYNSMYVHTGSAYTADFYGKESEIFQGAQDYNYEGMIRRLQINDNSVFVNQLTWDGKLSDRLKYTAGAAVNYINGQEPDRRILMFQSVGNGNVQLLGGEGRNQRFNSQITETAILPKVNLQYNLLPESNRVSYVEVGYDGRISTKDFSAPIYNLIWAGGQANSPTFDRNNILLDQYFNQQNLDDADFRVEYFNDPYDVKRNNHGAYVDAVHQLSGKLTLNAGLRADNVSTKINYRVNRGVSIGSNEIDGLFFSPSINAKLELNRKNHLRLGASRTFTLPQDKEISPFIYQGIDGNDNGNPDLEVSTNYNFDLKWDWYLSGSELLTINGFYKYIVDPIARVDQGNSAGLRTFDNVSDKAVAAGVELELRKQVLSLASNKHKFSLGLNGSYIYTNVKLDPQFFVQNTSSQLEGAAPYIVNADITHNLAANNFKMTNTLVFNYLSDKVHTIGSRGYNNLIEESIATLDFVSLININKHLGLNVKAKNLLNPDYKLTREGAAETNIPAAIIRSYKKGMMFDLGISYRF